MANARIIGVFSLAAVRAPKLPVRTSDFQVIGWDQTEVRPLIYGFLHIGKSKN